MQRITSRHNPLVARFREVANGTIGDRILLDGEHLLRDALAAGVPVEAAAFAAESLDELPALADAVLGNGGTIVSISSQVLDAISPVRQPSGIVAIAERPRHTVDDVVARKPQLLALLAGVQDPGNVGAIVRAAEGCGATGVITVDGTADAFGWKALRGAMGSTLRLPVATDESLSTTIGRVRERGIRVLATAPRGGTPLPAADLRTPCAILLGGEGSGLPADAIGGADEQLTIPMRAGIESLNVAVAAAIVLYEACRQRMGFGDVAVR